MAARAFWYLRGTPARSTTVPRKTKTPLARGGFWIAGAGFEPATFGL